MSDRECRRSRVRDTNDVRVDAIDTSSNSFDVESALTIVSQNRSLTVPLLGTFSLFYWGMLSIKAVKQGLQRS